MTGFIFGVALTLLVLYWIASLCEWRTGEGYLFSFLLFAAYVFVFEYFSSKLLYTYATTHFSRFAFAILGYILVGFVWATIRWFFEARKHAVKALGLYKRWLKENNLSEGSFNAFVTAVKGHDFSIRSLNDGENADDLLEPLSVRDNRDLLATWIVAWVPDLFNVMLFDVLVDGGIRLIKALLQSISNRIYRNINSPLPRSIGDE